jgi:hypothetical protein
MNFRKNLPCRVLLVVGCLSVGLPAGGAEPQLACTLQTEHVQWTIGVNGRSLGWVDLGDQQDYCPPSHPPVATVKKAGKYHAATAAELKDGLLELHFGEAGVQAVLRATAQPRYLLMEVVSLAGEGVEELVFVDLPLTLKGQPGEPLAACALALNLKTKVNELPQPSSQLRAACYPRFGFAGAQVALIGCPPDKLREVMQEVVSAAADLPKSPLGGPWALGQPINQGSYLFNFADMSEDRVEDWIKLAKRLGMTQIDFHGGTSFRFGDCRPNPTTYPRGFDSLKAVIDRLHAAGIAAGLHTYAFFIAKDCPWVTPVPDPRLAKDAVFTLAEPLTAEAAVVPVVESTEQMSAITGFFVRNSVTLQIDDELITYTGVTKQAPFQFTGCHRGACGTRVAAHAQGAEVKHLKECFGLFVPEADSTLLAEVAGKTAEAYNRCGFDMIYLDALDGEDILGGPENGWHYGSKFAFEIFQRLDKPALMEMSTFHHHLWYIRSRYCAWDHPTRSHKRFIDIHLEDNLRNRRMFMPGEFGWWALKSWTGAQGERTFPDDIEYLMGKCLGLDTGMAMMGIDPSNVDTIPALPLLADIIRRYEDLRHSGQVPEPIKTRLSQPGAEFTLIGDLVGGWQFRPAQYAKHRVETGEWSRVWQVENTFARQPARLRIEALMSAGPYDAPGNVPVADFTKPEQFSSTSAAGEFGVELKSSQEQVKAGGVSGLYAATNSGATPRGAWTRVERPFDPPLDLSQHQALGLWVYGDGQQQVLNLQLRSPTHVSHGIGDHYIPIDFTGWRYFELIEPEGERHAQYAWPYGGIYSIYRESVSYGQVASLGLWYNHLPPGQRAVCYLSPIQALPLVSTKLVNPAVSIAGQRVVFPVEIESGCYLECHSADDCQLYGPQGQRLRSVVPEGEIPWLEAGANEVRFECGASAGASPRANVTVISFGEPLK